MHETYITNAKVLDVIVKSKNVFLKLSIDGREINPFVFVLKKFKGMPLFKKGQQTQVRISRGSGISVVPTFFDSKQRCKECGRFYKLYCKHCYERFKNLGVVIDRFEEDYLKGLEDYAKGLKNE